MARVSFDDGVYHAIIREVHLAGIMCDLGTYYKDGWDLNEPDTFIPWRDITDISWRGQFLAF
jgi:hypothetical protein